MMIVAVSHVGALMKLLVGGGLLVGAAALLYVFVDRQPAVVFDMQVKDAYIKLTNVDFCPMSEGQVALNTVKKATGNGKDKVVWLQQGDMARYECAIDLAALPDNAAKTHVTVTCSGGGAGDGAAAGMVHNMHRNGVIERIDATLTGRPFDSDKIGSTASRWPGDGVDGSLATAQKEALQMSADMAKMERDMQAQAKSDAFNADVDSSDFASGGGDFAGE